MAGIEPEDVPGSPKRAYEEVEKQFEGKDLVAFPPASFARSNAVGILSKTAEERGLKTMLDLKRQSPEMTLKGEYYCHVRANCLGGLERAYGIVFESFTVAEPPARLYKALAAGGTDAAMLVTTEGLLARKGDRLAIIEDDEHRLPAGNALWLTNRDVVEEAGPDYEKAILAAQKGLTLKVMRELDAEIELEKKPPAKVAAEYLKSIHYTD